METIACVMYHRRRSVFIVNFERISPIVLVFPLLTLIKEMPGDYTNVKDVSIHTISCLVLQRTIW